MVTDEPTLIYLGGADAVEPEYDILSLVATGGVGVLSPPPLSGLVTLETGTGLHVVTLTATAPPGSTYDVYMRDGRTGVLSHLSLTVTVAAKSPPPPPSQPPPSSPPGVPLDIHWSTAPTALGETIELARGKTTPIFVGGTYGLRQVEDSLSLVPKGSVAVVSPGSLTGVVYNDADTGLQTLSLKTDAPGGTVYDVYARDGSTGELYKTPLEVTVVDPSPEPPPSPPPPSAPPSSPPPIPPPAPPPPSPPPAPPSALAAATLALAASARPAPVAPPRPRRRRARAAAAHRGRREQRRGRHSGHPVCGLPVHGQHHCRGRLGAPRAQGRGRRQRRQRVSPRAGDAVHHANLPRPWRRGGLRRCWVPFRHRDATRCDRRDRPAHHDQRVADRHGNSYAHSNPTTNRESHTDHATPLLRSSTCATPIRACAASAPSPSPPTLASTSNSWCTSSTGRPRSTCAAAALAATAHAAAALAAATLALAAASVAAASRGASLAAAAPRRRRRVRRRPRRLRPTRLHQSASSGAPNRRRLARPSRWLSTSTCSFTWVAQRCWRRSLTRSRSSQPVVSEWSRPRRSRPW